MLNGLIALAPASAKGSAGKPAGQPERLEKGPAFGTTRQSAIRNSQSEAWPTYRHDPGRSGSTSTDVPADLKLRWTGKLAGRLSAPVAAEGKVLVASVDTHGVHALDAETGRKIWSYTADGPVDTPPTLHTGLALFGCRNGCVYGLCADDGKLAWKFRAASGERLVGGNAR